MGIVIIMSDNVVILSALDNDMPDSTQHHGLGWGGDDDILCI